MKRGIKIFMALFMASAFAALSFAKINWIDNLDTLLERAELEDKIAAFFIPENGDKTLNDIPEFREREFLDFIQNNVLFYKVGISISGKTYKIKDKKAAEFLSKFLKEDNVLYKGAYKMVLFKHPNRFYIYTGTADRNSLKNAAKEKSDKRIYGDISALSRRSQMFYAMEHFAKGSFGLAIYDKPARQSAGSAKNDLYILPHSVGKLQELAEKEGKYIAFVVAKDTRKIFKEELFENESFKNYAAGNIIFVPVRKIYSQSAGKAKIVDAQYADFIASLGVSAAFGISDVILFYHPKRRPFYSHISMEPSRVCQQCELYKRNQEGEAAE